MSDCHQFTQALRAMSALLGAPVRRGATFNSDRTIQVALVSGGVLIMGPDPRDPEEWVEERWKILAEELETARRVGYAQRLDDILRGLDELDELLPDRSRSRPHLRRARTLLVEVFNISGVEKERVDERSEAKTETQTSSGDALPSNARMQGAAG